MANYISYKESKARYYEEKIAYYEVQADFYAERGMVERRRHCLNRVQYYEHELMLNNMTDEERKAYFKKETEKYGKPIKIVPDERLGGVNERLIEEAVKEYYSTKDW